MRRIKHFLLGMAILFETGCASVYGVKLRSSNDGNEGRFVAGCENLAQSANVASYNTTSYLTTLASAWTEGMSAGLQEGMQESLPEQRGLEVALLSPQKHNDDILIGSLNRPRSFCYPFSVERGVLTDAVQSLLPVLGNPMMTNDAERGRFTTDFIDRSQWASKWKDRYTIEILDFGPSDHVVRVTRSVYISRQGSDYIEASSAGINETWIISEIRRKLTE